ncbi:MAG TPA: methylated-DNA--[protein]-cysteine S-methyltransferase [Candidatus Binataceae bacterium]|nr:methylated-DNA--[protein]-cysteine S-methyltransferase [Candidatus Binataceae bacterium]
MNSASDSFLRYDNDGIGELCIKSASYGADGRDARLSYTIAATPFGKVLIATTERGLCWIGVHQSVAHLESELRADLPKAEIGRADVSIAASFRPVIEYLTDARRSIEVCVDIRATPFQLAVWRELCAIPRGTTRSYGEIACRLGRPSAARAVGHANGSNPLAILIPCHRAIGSDGTLTGYRWGLEYKRRLLDRERASAQTSLALGVSDGLADHVR